jgi:D-arginine dehydrogenase
VNASGAWADEIAKLASLTPLGLIPKRRSMAVTALPECENSEHWPCFEDVDINWYAKPESVKLLISPADADPVDACGIQTSPAISQLATALLQGKSTS